MLPSRCRKLSLDGADRFGLSRASVPVGISFEELLVLFMLVFAAALPAYIVGARTGVSDPWIAFIPLVGAYVGGEWERAPQPSTRCSSAAGRASSARTWRWSCEQRRWRTSVTLQCA